MFAAEDAGSGGVDNDGDDDDDDTAAAAAAVGRRAAGQGGRRGMATAPHPAAPVSINFVQVTMSAPPAAAAPPSTGVAGGHPVYYAT